MTHLHLPVRRSISFLVYVAILAVIGLGVRSLSQQQPGSQSGSREDRFRQMSKEAETRGLQESFKGVTTNGTVVPGLFPVRSTGVSTEPVRKAASTFLGTLTKDQRARTEYSVDDQEWRKWMNQHFYIRQGTSFKEMSDAQRESAIGLLRASLSAKGLKLSRDIMNLNHTLGELNNNDFEQYGDSLYWITVMGTPSEKEPWGWQLDGHHLIINYFVMADQVVMTPTFMGSEPVIAHAGKYAGTSVMQDEQNKALGLLKALDDKQRAKAVISVSKSGNNNVGEAFKDNVVLDYAGIKGSELSGAQKEQLLGVINEYVRNMREGHAKVRMDEVKNHINDTWFAWVGGSDATSVFYYRIQSPVILIEFDHQLPIALRHLDRRTPTREHIHSVVRTPNGNDYGKDLLKQHYQTHPHPHNH